MVENLKKKHYAIQFCGLRGRTRPLRVIPILSVALRGLPLAVLILSFCLPALAHSPHDDVFDVKISPNFSRDHSVFAIVRSNFFASRDGGTTWQRMVKGLDYKHMLFDLDIADDGKTLYLASLGDGIYRSTDAGRSWAQANKGLDTLTIDLVVAAPQSSEIAFAAGAQTGLFRTLNGGESWHRVKENLGEITALKFYPRETDHLLVGNDRGELFRSRDGGESWTKLFETEAGTAITALSLPSKAPSDATILLGTSEGRILRSGDGGETFSVTPFSASALPVRSIEFSPSFQRDQVAFASVWNKGVYVSDDGGRQWKRRSDGLTLDRQSKIVKRPDFGQLSVSPNFEQDGTVFLAGFDGLFRSQNDGKSWQELTTLSPLNLVGIGLSPDFRNDSTLALSTWMWGAYLSKDAGRSWHPINKGTIDYPRDNGLTRLFDIVFSPAYPEDSTLFTTTWYRLLKSTDGGSNWRQIVPLDDPEWTESHHGCTLALSPKFESDGTVFLGTHRGLLLKSTDSGESFKIVKDVEHLVGSVVISPAFLTDRTVFAGDTRGVYRSRDAGASWEFTSLVGDALFRTVPTSPAYPVGQTHETVQRDKSYGLKLALSPDFATDGTGFAGTPNGLFRTRNAGESWQRLEKTPFQGDAYIEAVAVSPEFAKDRLLLVSIRGEGLFRSTDGGDSFVEIGKSLLKEQILFAHYAGMVPKFPAIVFSPAFGSDKTIYALSGPRLFKTADGGVSWQSLQTPSPSLITKGSVWLRHSWIRLRKRLEYYTFHSRKAQSAAILMLLAGGAGYAFVHRWKTKRQKEQGT